MPRAGGTSTARGRREREGFYEEFLWGTGIDIGCGDDPVLPGCACFDRALGHGDATVMPGVQGPFDWVYSSHLLEHLEEPERALGRWWELLRPGGRLVLYVPHRDLYEKRRTLPSRFNREHRLFLLPDRDEPPTTFGLAAMVARAAPRSRLILLRVCALGWEERGPETQSPGEFSIEGVWVK